MLKRLSFAGLIVAFVLVMVPFLYAQDEPVQCDMEYTTQVGDAAAEDGLPPDSDGIGSYGIAIVGGRYFWYCNKDQVNIPVRQRLHMAQWAGVWGYGLDRDVYLRKPGQYTYCGDLGDIVFSIVSNGRVKFLPHATTWDAPWFGPNGTGPVSSEPLTPQTPIDKMYLTTVEGTKAVVAKAGDLGLWKEYVPEFDILNSKELHGGADYGLLPLVTVRIKEMLRVKTCVTAGQYNGEFYVDIIPQNQKPFINRTTGGFKL